MSNARIYIVTVPDETPKLVRAISQSQAVKHVTRPYIAIPATADDVAQWMAKGVKVENAGADDDNEARS